MKRAAIIIRVINFESGGGLQTVTRQQIKILKANGFSLDIYYNQRIGKPPSGVNVIHYEPAIDFDKVKAKDLKKEQIRSSFSYEQLKKYDIILNVAKINEALYNPEKTFNIWHGALAPELPGYKYKSVRERYHKSKLILVSNYALKSLSKKYPNFPKRNCFVLHNSVELPKRYAKHSDKKVKKIFYAGQWSYNKGMNFLLRAIQLLEEKRDDFELVLAGGPSLWPSKKPVDDKSYIQNLLNNEGIKNLKSLRIVGKVSHDKMVSLYSGMDILVQPSLREGLSCVILESLAAGLPVVAFNLTGIPEAMGISKKGEKCRTGILLEYSQSSRVCVERLAGAIEKLLDNYSLRKSLGIEGRKIAKSKFGINEYSEKFKTLILNNH